METVRRSQRIKSMQKCSYCDSHHHANKNMKKNSNNTKTCKVISKLLLPEDLMIHIFTLLPLTCLFNSARYVCKSWAITICSSDFAAAFECRGHSRFGLYVENRMYKSSSYFLDFKDDMNGQFERIDLGTPPKMGHVISTCDGLLLLWNGYMQTYVVNPILKCWLRIPPLPSSLKYSSLSCNCTITRDPRTSKFKFFHINILEVSGVIWYVCYVLRIGIYNSWKEIARKESPPDTCIHWQRLCSGGNDLYWITNKEVIVVDVDREIIIGEYPLHNLTTFSSYLMMGNRLCCFVHTNINGTYQFYIFCFDSEKWSLYCKIGLIDFVAACGHKLDIIRALLCVWINDHIIFRVFIHKIQTKCTENIHFYYNVKSKQLTKIEDIDIDMGMFEVWLHTNSLVSLPSSQA